MYKSQLRLFLEWFRKCVLSKTIAYFAAYCMEGYVA